MADVEKRMVDAALKAKLAIPPLQATASLLLLRKYHAPTTTMTCLELKAELKAVRLKTALSNEKRLQADKTLDDHNMTYQPLTNLQRPSGSPRQVNKARILRIPLQLVTVGAPVTRRWTARVRMHQASQLGLATSRPSSTCSHRLVWEGPNASLAWWEGERAPSQGR